MTELKRALFFLMIFTLLAEILYYNIGAQINISADAVDELRAILSNLSLGALIEISDADITTGKE